MTCFSCIHYRKSHFVRHGAGEPWFQQENCVLELEGFPTVGAECKSFVREPGSDEQERENDD